MYMIMFILDDSDLLDQVLEAWAELGISGATIIESTGLHRRRQCKHIPMRYAYGETESEECGNTTIFVIVEGEAMVHACLDATEKITGDLNAPNSGVFASWPLSVIKGVPRATGKS